MWTGSPPSKTGDSVGSTATISMSGKIRFNSYNPVTVPPVPTPETNASKPRLPTSTISFPVFVHVPLD